MMLIIFVNAIKFVHSYIMGEDEKLSQGGTTNGHQDHVWKIKLNPMNIQTLAKVSWHSQPWIIKGLISMLFLYFTYYTRHRLLLKC